MIITESFVMLNYPKTGSSFARKVVKELYQRQPRDFSRRFIKELLLPNIREAGSPPDQHGTYGQIPARYRNREVVSVIRNPYERFLSGYEFRHWAFHPPLPVDVIRERFPQFPDLTLDEYIDFRQFALGPSVFRGLKPAARIGEQTAQFIQMFFKDPQSVLANITDQYLDSDHVFQDLPEITFLRQEHLNEELSAFLRRHGFAREETTFIEDHEPVNVTGGKSPDRNTLWTRRAINYVLDKERMIFRIFNSKGISFGPPLARAA